MKGGERYGAGRPAWHNKTSATLSMDIRQLHRGGHLKHGRTISWQWSNVASVEAMIEPRSLTLQRWRVERKDWQPIHHVIGIVQTACHFGGARPWFQCPRCYRRVAVIYFGGWPACRQCRDLRYPSQSQDAFGRTWRKSHRLENRLAGGSGEWNGRRPKGMRRATFERLCDAHEDLERQRDGMLGLFAARLMGLRLQTGHA